MRTTTTTQTPTSIAGHLKEAARKIADEKHAEPQPLQVDRAATWGRMVTKLTERGCPRQAIDFLGRHIGEDGRLDIRWADRAGKPHPEADVAKKTLVRCVQGKRFVVLCGPNGVGKTVMACAMLWHCAETLKLPIRYWTAADAWADFRGRCHVKQDMTEPEWIERNSGKRTVLVIDELDKLNGLQRDSASSASSAWMERMIAQRYADCAPTIFVTNLKQGAMMSILPLAAANRFHEIATFVECGWNDYRSRP